MEMQKECLITSEQAAWGRVAVKDRIAQGGSTFEENKALINASIAITGTEYIQRKGLYHLTDHHRAAFYRAVEQLRVAGIVFPE